MKALFLLAALFLFVGAVVFRLGKFQLAEAVYYLQNIYFIFVLLYLLNEWQRAKSDTEDKLEQAEKSKQYCEAYDELRTLVRERQHDMDNHISAILGMAYTIYDRDELIRSQQAYYMDLREGHEEIKLYLSVENRMIAGFLHIKIQEAAKYHIKVTNRIAFREKVLPVPEYDFIEMTGILLDNAVEALTGVGTAGEKAAGSAQTCGMEAAAEREETNGMEEAAEREETDGIETAGAVEIPRKIYLEIINGKDGLHILTANASIPLSPEKMTLFFQEDYTSKGKGRGIGLKKLKKMTQSFGGEVVVSGGAEEDAWFVKVEVVIPRK